MNSRESYNLITILGPTAVGKTGFAARIAAQLNGEIISADSRQVYREMDIATGKDYADYLVDGKAVPCHLIDIVDPGYEYNVYEYQKDFIRSFEDITGRKKMPVLCGGSGLYIEAVLKGYKLIRVPVNAERRKVFEEMSDGELSELLASCKNLHNISDTSQRKRLIRALEIEEYYKDHPEINLDYPRINPLLIGLSADRDVRRAKITDRLASRMENGMVEEAKRLVEKGLGYDKLVYYGLEYKYLAMYLQGQLNYEEMFARLNTAIHQFSKRQMTWFRKMEREGFIIHWMDADLPVDEKVKQVLSWLEGSL